MPKQVLLVDDSQTIAKMVEITFAHGEYVVTVARTGDEALARAKMAHPDVVLLDVGLPDRSGYEVCAALLQEGLRGVPVVMLTSHFAPYDEARGKQAGAVGGLIKPFETQQLIDKVDQLTGKVAAPAAHVGTPASPAAPVTPAALARHGEPGRPAEGPRQPRPTLMGMPAINPNTPPAAQPTPPFPPSKTPPGGRPLPPPPSAATLPTVAAPLAAKRPEAERTLIDMQPVGSVASTLPPPRLPAIKLTSAHAPLSPPAAPRVAMPPLAMPSVLVPPASPPATAPPAAPPTGLGVPPAITPRSVMAVPHADVPKPVDVDNASIFRGIPEKVPLMPRPSLIPNVPAPRPAGMTIEPSDLDDTQRFAPLPALPSAPSVDEVVERIAAKSPEHEAVARLSREVIEKIAWEVVPELAEAIIRAQLAQERPRG